MGKGLDLKQMLRQSSTKAALAIVLMLASASAAALGLGQIVVKSRIGQPLLAEIPIISNDPAELEQLRAGLASPDTFARIGLEPPRGIVAVLQFAPALDAAGRPIIRVTSAQPVTEPLLTFLVQVDWGQGRLVREYSALVDTPRTVSAPLQPPIDAPSVAQPDVIERPPPVVITPTPVVPAPATARTPAPAANGGRAAEPARRDNGIAVGPPRPAPARPSADATRPSPVASQYGPVKAGESLSQIAGRLDLPDSMSIEQSMIALLRANPAAFIGGNINQLKQGAVLRVPAAAEIADLEVRQAVALVQAQARQWRQARRGSPPTAVAVAGGVPLAAPKTAPGKVRAPSGARLEIIPPGASRATRAGTQSGITAGGEGQMLRQELQQTKESLAARDAELRELKGRVADLEKLQADQQQLLTLKDSELAAAQQRLATSNKAAALPTAPAKVSTAVTAQAASPAQTPSAASVVPWVLGGVVALVLAVLAAWLLRRRRAPIPRFVAPSAMSASSLADAFAAFPATSPVQESPEKVSSRPARAVAQRRKSTAMPVAEVEDAVIDPTNIDATSVDEATPPLEPAQFESIDPTHSEVEAPAELWSRRDRQKLPTGRPELAAAPAWHSGKPRVAGSPVPVPAVVTPVGERLELAQAYLDLGDGESARQLLAEVADSGDAASRQQASRMLRELE